jgi:hypothetical protein
VTFSLSTGVPASVDPILAQPASPYEGGDDRRRLGDGALRAAIAGVAPPRLDRGTLLVPGTGEGWAGTVYPDAGEAVMWREPGYGADASPVEAEAADGTSGGPRLGPTADALPTDPAENQRRASRRSKGRVRRYAVANRCTRLWTFTYGQANHSTARAKRDWAAFARRLKERRPDLAWVRVLELHPGGHGVHIHAGLSEYLPKPELARLWGHGFVDARKIRTKRGGGEDARAAARYLAKYATKAAETSPGEHAYEVAQGHQPVAVRVRAWESHQLYRELVGLMWGEVPSYEWDSSGDPEWRGPPVRFLSW